MASGWDQATKKVIRDNGRSTGETIWDTDAQNGQVIDSTGHDINDQRLADSITECLHIGGFNEMQADLKMNSYKITGLQAGTSPSDGVNVSQITNINSVSIKTSGLKSKGTLRHLVGVSSGNLIVNPSVANRYRINNGSGATVTFQLPTGADDYLGNEYQMEGQILVTNGPGGGGPINLETFGPVSGPVPAGLILGTQPVSADTTYVLTYILQHGGSDSYDMLFIWTAP